MFTSLGQFVERHASAILVAWMLVLIAAMGLNHGWINAAFGTKLPRWFDVAEDGEFNFLPKNMPSLEGERLLAAAFPEDLLKSSVVIVVRRIARKLTDEDKEFVEKTLKPRLDAIMNDPESDKIIREVFTFNDKKRGQLLRSEDGHATLVIVALTTEFLEMRNKPTIEKIERLLFTELRQGGKIPDGMHLALSGSATYGRDMMVANKESARATELWTFALVVFLLIAIYRAPILAPIPLLTVFTAVEISRAFLTLLTQAPWLGYRVFMGMEVYITVVVYGAGIDYCVFLISRFKEELDTGVDAGAAVRITLTKIGAALVASAGTVICGIGMMVFAQFGKFREAGVGISLSLCFALLAGLTFTPAILRLAGRGAFWPFGLEERIGGGDGASTSVFNRLNKRNRIQVLWEEVGRLIITYPGRLLLVCYMAMMPFAAIGFWYHDYLSYGLLSELPPTNQSRIGADAVQKHFPAGYAGPLTILLRAKTADADFSDEESPSGRLLSQLAGHLTDNIDRLNLDDIRYLESPWGKKEPPEDVSPGGAAAKVARRSLRRELVLRYYISRAKGVENQVTRLDLIFNDDPFSRDSIQQFAAVKNEIDRFLASNEIENAPQVDVFFVGPTASISDLKAVTDHDQVKIDALVLACVFLILLILLRKLYVSMYLIASVFFSYLATLGVTLVVFWWWDPNFAGLDWKVPMFLFTILIAIGEDYNIFLMSRIEEEQEHFGPIEGIRVAMLQTGSIISSCGIIMAGTFLSLMAGSLVGMKQLGFALAFGVLLDTFVVRTMLVPGYLVMLEQGRFGFLTRWMGRGANAPVPSREPARTT
jgi:RND superfamily putative drug exporter